MSRVAVLLAAAAAAIASSLPALAGEAFTTRIEPRGFYGATISIEEGVRVFRPLPPVRHVVVNPGGATPLTLSYTDVREHRTSVNYNYDNGGGATYGGGAYGIGGGYYGARGGHGHVKHTSPGGVPVTKRGGHHGGGGGKGGHH